MSRAGLEHHSDHSARRPLDRDNLQPRASQGVHPTCAAVDSGRVFREHKTRFACTVREPSTPSMQGVQIRAEERAQVVTALQAFPASMHTLNGFRCRLGMVCTRDPKNARLGFLFDLFHC